MRLSTHTRILPVVRFDGTTDSAHALLFNGLYGAMDVLSAQEAASLVSNSLCHGHTLGERLLRRGHLTRESPEAEENTLCFLSRLCRLRLRPFVSFDITPTYGCNFRCPYCFENHRLAKGDEYLSQRMSTQTLDAFFASIERHLSRGGVVPHVNLFGGEPLLAKNLDLVRTICKRCSELGIPIEAVTNGYDLDAYLDIAIEFKWRDVQVTIDGFGELTDRLRRHVDGTPTYERIVSNVSALSARGIRTCIRVLVDRDRLGRMHEVVEDFRARGLDGDDHNFGYHFSPVLLFRTPEREVTPRQILDALMEQGLSFDEARGHVVLCRKTWTRALRDMKKKALPEVTASACSATEGRMSVDPFGRVFRCFHAVGRDDAEVGEIDPDGKFVPNANALLWQLRDAAHLPKCRKCPYVFKCGGGCAARAFYQSGSWFKPHCGNIFDVYDFTLPRVVGRTWAEGHDPELTLSWAEPLSQIPKADRERFMGLVGCKEQVAFARNRGWFELINSFARVNSDRS